MTEQATESPVDPRALALLENQEKRRWGHMQLLYAFQTLTLKRGLLTRGFTRTMAAEMINEFIGHKAVTRSTHPPVPPSDRALEHYVTWAIGEAERRLKKPLDLIIVPLH